MDAAYKLIHAVDPTKIKVNIKDKFSKLTLSSNKKKLVDQEDKTAEAVARRVSRNLMDDPAMKDNPLDKRYINPLLRTDTSSTEDIVSSTDADNQQNTSAQDALFDKSMDMEPLQVSDYSLATQTQQQLQVDDDTELLSQRVSCLTLVPTAITLSSTEDVSCDPKTLDTRKTTNPDISICISSSSETEQSDDEAITISESSPSEDYEQLTSNIPQSGETADALLPSTFSNEKADRMDAFLRDVSVLRKEYEMENVYANHKTTLDPLKYASTEPEENYDKAKHFAVADTEPMSSEASCLTAAKINHAMDDTEAMSLTNLTHFQGDSEPTLLTAQQQVKPSAERRLANDETVANTLVSFSQNSIEVTDENKSDTEPHKNESTTSDTSTHSAPPPDDSIIISETESETSENVNAVDSGAAKATVLSEQRQTQSLDSSSSRDCTQLTQFQGSINISAKINIKIHISQQIASDEEQQYDETDPDSSNRSSSHSSGQNKHQVSSGADDNNANNTNSSFVAVTADEGSSNANRPENCATAVTPTDFVAPKNAAEEENEEDFMQNAQKLLNQLYGKTWQTPEVIRTLNRTKSISAAAQPPIKQLEKQPKVLRRTTRKADESMLDDFSIFRKNINTNLDSTRTVDATPTGKGQTKNFSTEPRPKPIRKVANTAMATKSARKGDGHKDRWRQLVDSDSEGQNASDDDNADATVMSDSDDSWSKANKPNINNNNSSDDDDDSDFETRKTRSTKKPQNNPKRQTSSTRGGRKPAANTTRAKRNALVYLDLSKDEVEIMTGTPSTPAANNDDQFNSRLQNILSSCRFEEKTKLPATPTNASINKPKRKLFTQNFDNEEINVLPVEAPKVAAMAENDKILDKENVSLNQPMPAIFEPFNKQLEAVKNGTPIFKMPTPKTATKTKARTNLQQKPVSDSSPSSPSTPKRNIGIRATNNVSNTPKDKYGFLKSLDVCVGKSLCHPDALVFRDNYRLKKDELSKILYNLYNEKLFKNELQVPLVWNKKLLNTAGRCLNKKRLGIRTSVVELSEKVLTSADRLRCTLIHELCHAATWVFNGEGGHGATWKSWAHKANAVFPEIPKIGVCHQYDIEYKYTYKCTLCAAKSHAHSKSKKVENIRCSYCHGAIEIFLNKKDKEGNVVPTPVKEPTGFAKFVRDKYKEYKRPDLKHADVMKLLSSEFASLKVANAI